MLGLKVLSVIDVEAVIGTSMAAPIPGSVSTKYSALLMFCANDPKEEQSIAKTNSITRPLIKLDNLKINYLKLR
jgi:hypothetical protein